MKSKWFVQCNPIGGEYHYIASRVLNTSETVHSGNLEHCGNYSKDKSEVQKIVDRLNEEERKRESKI